jgi:hypothetical protein
LQTKDDLINALYREIKLELADAMMSDSSEEECSCEPWAGGDYQGN